MAFVDDLDTTKPHSIELLGKRLVLWRDAEKRWRTFEDKCPHRLAPLSGELHLPRHYPAAPHDCQCSSSGDSDLFALRMAMRVPGILLSAASGHRTGLHKQLQMFGGGRDTCMDRHERNGY